MKERSNRQNGFAREKILASTRETDDFMREYRTYNDDLVVIKQAPVALHLYRHREEPVRKLSDLWFRNKANLAESIRVIPLMVEDANIGVLGGSFATCDLQARIDCLFGHRRMCSQRDQHIECACH